MYINKYMACHKNSILCLIFLICFLPTLSLSATQEEYSEAMLLALENDDIDSFSRILKEGGDPTISMYNPANPLWVMCVAADKNTDAYIKLIAEHGWDLNFRHEQWADNIYDASSETALFCSKSSLSLEPFKFLIESGVNVDIKECHRCLYESMRNNLVENLLISNRYEKAFWLLENTSFAAEMVTKKAIEYLSLPGTSISEGNKPWYMKTVHTLRDMGYQVETDYTRLVEKPDSVEE